MKPRGAQQSVRLAIWVVQAISIGLALVELGRFATTGDRRLLVIGAVAVAITMPLHLQHLRYGLRGLRPPRSEITFGLMLLVHAAALLLIGPLWGFMLATLATSGLIVLRPRWAGLLLLACCLAVLPRPIGRAETVAFTGNHLFVVYGVVWRSTVQFALVRLVATAYQLAVARDSIAAEAAARERHRLRDQLRTVVRGRVAHIERTAKAARHVLIGPEVAGAVLALDRIVRLADEALADLRRTVAGRDGDAAEAPSAALAYVAAADASPIGGALSAPSARRLAIIVYAVLVSIPLLWNALDVMGTPAAYVHHQLVAGLASIPLIGVTCAVALAAASARRPRWAPAAVVGVALLAAGLLPLLGEQWNNSFILLAPTAALALRGRARIVCLTLIVAIPIADSLGIDVADGKFFLIGRAGLLGPIAVRAWGGFYELLEYVVMAGGMYAVVRLVALAAELKATRAELARASVEAERRRVSNDVHDLVGQGLTALSIKADLARRLARSDRARATVELDDVIRLASGQMTELDAATRGRHPITFVRELANALALLDAAGVTTESQVELDELDEATSAVLGWVVREGTTNILRHANPTRCAFRAMTTNGDITVEISNDGAGAAGPSGTGLHSLANRVREAHGALTTDQDADGSFHLNVTLPALVPA